MTILSNMRSKLACFLCSSPIAAAVLLMERKNSSGVLLAEKSSSREPFPSFDFVEDEELLHVPVLAPEAETTFQKFKRKFSSEPLVPLGFLTTAGVLTAGLWTFKKGNDPAKAQRLMRYRVVAQGFTVAAFGAGAALTYFADKWENEARDARRM
eukprot:g3085.t1